jgi:lycopene beta-cyclase
MSPRHSHYDMIFLGGGCAALSLLVRLLDTTQFSHFRFLVIDPSEKKSNDRTWCFWERGEGYFESLVYKQWAQLNFYGPATSIDLDMSGYRYKMIRGLDFYRYCMDRLEQSGRVEWIREAVTSVQSHSDHFRINGQALTAAVVFNSIYRPTPARVDLLQHFKGWTIETQSPVFDSARATLMDFTVSQQAGTTFVYVMPYDERRALVEYTLFTRQLLSEADYEAGLRQYISAQLGIGDRYRVTEEEFGVIPMTTRRFRFFEEGIFNLGMAGGQTKASSGYTFQFIQKQSQQLVALLSDEPADNWAGALQHYQPDPARFHFYDRVLLNVIDGGHLSGQQVFTRLFERNPAHAIFQFLDNETDLMQELRIISSLPVFPFMRAAIKSIQ